MVQNPKAYQINPGIRFGGFAYLRVPYFQFPGDFASLIFT